MTLQIRPTTIVCTAVIAGALPLLGIVKAQVPAFEVASIRVNTTTAAAGLRAMPNGRLIATNVPLRLVIQRAFKLHDAQIVGAPDWAATERFDLDARTAVPPAGGPDAVMPLLQPLLRDRFGLRAHMEVRDLPAYVLVVAHRDRPLGPHIRPTEADCSRATTLSQQEIRASARDGWPPCGMAFTVSYVASRTGGTEEVMQTRIRRAGITLQDLAAGLQEGLDRPVVDDTKLDGRFDVEYTFAPRPPAAGTDSPFGEPQPMLFVALEEQLGLKLEARRTAVPVLVVDEVRRPTPN